MIDAILEMLKGKRILILGFGKEGQSSWHFLRSQFPDQWPDVADSNESLAVNLGWLTQSGSRLYLGNNYTAHADEYDIIIKSPGISLNTLPAVFPFEKLSSQHELFLSAFRDQVIGITGTKGKSTTTSLILHLLTHSGREALLAGNIGIPPLSVAASVGPGTLIVYEMSSHQLEHSRVSPHVAVFLNVYQEHLDHYKDFDAYFQAKLNIARYQEKGDYLIYNADDPYLQGLGYSDTLQGTLLPVSADGMPESVYMATSDGFFLQEGDKNTEIISSDTDLPLKGSHNRLNILAALAACRLAGLTDKELSEGLPLFQPLAHRMEYVGLYRGIHFYNDSIATIPEAALAALEALPEVDTLILGGFDRGIDYSILGERLPQSTVRNIILTGEAGKRIGVLLEPLVTRGQRLFYASGYKEIVALAMEHTAKDKACLLSPAAASYDSFKNFEERGMEFVNLIREFR